MQIDCNVAQGSGEQSSNWLRLIGGILLGVLATGAAAAQQAPPRPLARQAVVRDSLTRLLAADRRADTTRVLRLNALSFLLRTNEAPRSQQLARQALPLAQQLGFARGELEAAFNLGYYYRAHNQYDSAIAYSQQALALARRTHSGFNQTRAYYNLARSYAEQGDYAAALAPSLDGLALARTLRNARATLFQLIQAARIEVRLGEVAAARAYVAEAQALVPAAHDPLGTGAVYLLLGDLSREQRQWRAARRYYQQVRTTYAGVYKAQGLLPYEILIAEMTYRLGELPAARQAATGLLRRARATGTPEQVAQAALLLARTWQPAQPDSARRYAALSLATARPHHLRPEARDAAQLLALVSDQRGQGHAAYQYQALASAYADSLSSEDTRHRLAAVQTRALRSRTQLQLDLLRQQQEVERLRQRQQLAGLGALALLALGLAGWLRGHYRRRQGAREATLRQRLAADLHDDVGNLLTQVSLQADLLRETPAASAEQSLARLQRLSDTSRRASRQMADVVWGLHTSALTLPELLTHMRDHAHEVLPAAGLAVDFGVAPDLAAHPPAPLTCQYLYLIYKEALHNAVKHARHATLVSVRVFADGPHLGLRVQDDGQALATAAEPGRAGGHGLRNMRQRAEALGGTLHAAAEPAGFALVVSLPLP
ncbi:MAG: histidine kinase [Janthinobacterium lividum]